MATALSDLMKEWQEKQEGARLSNIKRGEQITAIYDEIIRRYEPGGTFGKAALGQLEKQKVRDVGGEMQQMISSGLYGTTTAAGTGRRWEESVGAPARLRLEDVMMQRLSEAQTGKAGFMERVEEPYPDYATMASLTQQAAAGGGGGFAPQPTRAPAATQPSLAEFMRGFDVRGGGGAAPTRAPTTAAPTTTRATKPYTPIKPGEITMKPLEQPTTAGRQIPAQTTPAGMEEYLKTYTPQTGDVSAFPQQPTDVDASYKKYVADVYARGSYITSGTKKRWMKQQGYS